MEIDFRKAFNAARFNVRTGNGGFSLYIYKDSEIIFYLVVIPAALLIALAFDDRSPPVPMSARWIGDITYSVYLVHMPLMMIVKMWLRAQPNAAQIPNNPAFFLSWIAVVIVISNILHKRVEYPLQQWIQRKFRVTQTRRPIDREISQTI